MSDAKPEDDCSGAAVPPAEVPPTDALGAWTLPDAVAALFARWRGATMGGERRGSGFGALAVFAGTAGALAWAAEVFGAIAGAFTVLEEALVDAFAVLFAGALVALFATFALLFATFAGAFAALDLFALATAFTLLLAFAVEAFAAGFTLLALPGAAFAAVALALGAVVFGDPALVFFEVFFLAAMLVGFRRRGPQHTRWICVCPLTSASCDVSGASRHVARASTDTRRGNETR